MNGAIASIVLLLLENHRREFHISIKKKELFIKAQNLVPQHQLSRVVGKVAASENPVVKTAVIHAFKTKYGIDLSIAEQGNALKYKSFNDFYPCFKRWRASR